MSPPAVTVPTYRLHTSATSRVWRILNDGENTLLALGLGAMLILPLAEMMLRATLAIGIEGVSALVQHLTLVTAMLGAALAAREGRLLAFATAAFLPARAQRLARTLTAVLAITITAVLCGSGYLLVQSERLGGNTLAYGIPRWGVELVLPGAFGLILLRLARRGADSAVGRAVLVMTGAAVAGAWMFSPISSSLLVWPGLCVIALGVLLGLPVFAAIAGVSWLLLGANDVPLASVALDHYTLTTNSSLPAIPLFTLAGFVLAESAAPMRLINVFDAAFGRFRSGAAVVCALACTLFTSFTGASGIAILALGGLLIPLLRTAQYDERTALGLVTAAGLPGTILLPALPLILYAIVAKVPIAEMFVGGLLPAALMLSLVIAWGIRRRPARTEIPVVARARPRLRAALWDAKWELGLPVVPVLGLATGIASPVEAAAATGLYALVISTLINRDLTIRRDLPRVMAECGLLVGGILLILGVALALTNYFVDARIPEQAVAWVTGMIASRWVFLLALNGLLLLVGCVMDIYSAIIVIVPLIVPLGVAFGVHPVHLGIIFLANMELGYLTPPVGLNLFYASSRFDRPVLQIARAALPLFFCFAFGVLIITYVPWFSLGLFSF